ncbi:hypothetical protein [Roseibium album]|uniref:hypothetical protein n=1 Tax=Roseibium album TaxID=311410 RepID=UPI0039192C41
MKSKNAADVARNMFGPELYQERARRALPLLVQYAKARHPIQYQKLATALDMSNARNLNYVLGSVGRTLNELAEKQSKLIPRIQVLVVSKSRGLPSAGIDSFFGNLTPNNRSKLLSDEKKAVFNFKGWDRVLSDLSLAQISASFGDQIKSAREFGGGGGESEEHRRLKEWIRENPEILGLRNTHLAETERKLASGDSLDVSFQTSRKWAAAEVKASNASEPDLHRGIFQIVKYKAVMEAELKTSNLHLDVLAILVIEQKVSDELKNLAKNLSVEFVEVSKVEGGYKVK